MEKNSELLRLFESESEAERGQAAADPDSPIELQKKLGYDESEWVREQLARNPNLEAFLRLGMVRKETSLAVAKILLSTAAPRFRGAVWTAAMQSDVSAELRFWRGRAKLCPTPEKRKYRTEAQAIASGDGGQRGLTLFHYECLCGLWHNTKRSQDFAVTV